jgi:hypothetical protein
LQSIQERANNKEHMLAMVNAERKATNDRKRIERELFDSLRRDKVDSIQKMQVGGHGWLCGICNMSLDGSTGSMFCGLQPA